MKLAPDLREFVESFASRGVRFLVVGGHAVAHHGHPRFTGDIDLLLAPTPDNAELALAAVVDFGFTDLDLTAEDLRTPGCIAQLGRPPNRIDLLASIDGVDFEAAWSHRSEGDLDGIRVAFLGREELIANKRAAGRAKDLADLESLGEGSDVGSSAD